MKKRIKALLLVTFILAMLSSNAFAGNLTATTKYWGISNCYKVVITKSKVTKTLKNVTAAAQYNGVQPLHISYNQSASSTFTFNPSVSADIKNLFSIDISLAWSWTNAEVSGFVYDIGSGSKTGFYRMQYARSFDSFTCKKYFWPLLGSEWKPFTSGATETVLQNGSYEPFFRLAYSPTDSW